MCVHESVFAGGPEYTHTPVHRDAAALLVARVMDNSAWQPSNVLVNVGHCEHAQLLRIACDRAVLPGVLH